MIGQSKRLPGYATVESAGPVANPGPHFVRHEGEDYLVCFAEGLTTGVVVDRGQPPETGRVTITIWRSGEGVTMPIALSFLPDDAQIDAVIGSLTRFRDQKREAAATQADAVISKARRS